MISFKLQAIVLAREKFKECDGNVYILSKKDGVLKCSVKGLFKLNSKNLAFIQPGSFNTFLILTDLNKFRIISTLPLKLIKLNSLKNPYVFIWALKIIKNIGLPQTPPLIWFLVRHLDTYTNQNPHNFPYWFLFHIYRELGYELEIERCASCQRKLEKIAFFDNQKSLFCRDCSQNKNHPINPQEINQAKKIKDIIRIPQKIPPFLIRMIKNNESLLRDSYMIKFNHQNER
ncbi:MAG: DNA repair protein RecO C-terminal domain-containing protein [Patescibacteria group bacterium]|nr:DNA repair protein RecO C-terminal domain-containing protein [Patescibacteria group bacterium]